MPPVMTDASQLADEYRVLAEEAGWRRSNDIRSLTRLHSSLVETAEWTPEAAGELIRLAQEYGAFMLRNALALAVALDIQDGQAGY